MRDLFAHLNGRIGRGRFPAPPVFHDPIPARLGRLDPPSNHLLDRLEAGDDPILHPDHTGGQGLVCFGVENADMHTVALAPEHDDSAVGVLRMATGGDHGPTAQAAQVSEFDFGSRGEIHGRVSIPTPGEDGGSFRRLGDYDQPFGHVGADEDLDDHTLLTMLRQQELLTSPSDIRLLQAVYPPKFASFPQPQGGSEMDMELRTGRCRAGRGQIKLIQFHGHFSFLRRVLLFISQPTSG